MGTADGMTLLDAHVTVGTGQYFSLDETTLLTQMDRHGITQAFICPADRYVAVANAEGNAMIARLVEQHPDRFLGYAVMNPWFGPAGLKELESALQRGLHGLRLEPALQGFMMQDHIVEPVLQLAAQYRVPVYVRTGTPMRGLPTQVAEAALQYPEVDFILGRMGKPDFASEVIPSMESAPNLYAETVYNYPDYILQLVRLFGADRLLFSSDLPLTSLPQELSKLDDIVLTAEERRLVQGDSLRKLLAKRTANTRDQTKS